MRLIYMLLLLLALSAQHSFVYANENADDDDADEQTDESVNLGEINPDTDHDKNPSEEEAREQSVFYELTPEQEALLDLEDEKFTEKQRMTKMSVCFNSVQHLLVTQHETFRKLAQSVSEQQGVREDDALRMIMYTNIVGCYNLLSFEDAEKYANSAKFDDEFYAKITPQHTRVPSRFTEKQSDLFTKVVTKQNASKATAPALQLLTGRPGYIYMFVAVLCLMGGMALVVRYLGNQHSTTPTSHTGKKLKKKK